MKLIHDKNGKEIPNGGKVRYDGEFYLITYKEITVVSMESIENSINLLADEVFFNKEVELIEEGR